MSAAFPPSMRMYANLEPAGYLLDHKWAPEKAVDEMIARIKQVAG